MPTPYRIVLSARTAKNLDAIFHHIAKSSPDTAANVVRNILAELDGLKLFPHRTVVPGQPANAQEPVRSLPVRPYVVFFRVSDQRRVVRVLRIMHGAQRRPKRYE